MLLLCSASAASAQHQHGEQTLQLGAQAVGLLTHVTPAMLGEDRTEGYLTQPALFAGANFWRGRVTFMGVANFEGLTLDRGELNHGVWGEGYIDRRHPHTYLHEAVLTANHELLGADVSLSAGRGFAPFGTDDPMVRPFVKYPSNHHLAQILERQLVIGALRRGPVALEGAFFNGNEPKHPRDVGSLDRFGDSWSARLTVYPFTWLEMQASMARVESPEQPNGGGLDQRKRSAAARAEIALPMGVDAYALAEYAQTSDMNHDVEAFSFRSYLLEASAAKLGWTLAARYEDTTRPEEERLINPFRSVRPATDNSIIGTTHWRTITAAVQRQASMFGINANPFVEAQRSHARALSKFAVIQPTDLYGDDVIWTWSAGIRLGAGMRHARMGRYGAAAE